MTVAAHTNTSSKSGDIPVKSMMCSHMTECKDTAKLWVKAR